MKKKVDASRLVVSYRRIQEHLSVGSGGEEAGLVDPEAEKLAKRVEKAKKAIAKATGLPGVLSVPENGPASRMLSYLAEHATGSVRTDDGLEATFDDLDIGGWIKSLPTFFGAIKKAKFIGNTPIPEPAKNNLRIALLGDWGTGLYGAPVCAQTIRNASPTYDLVMHLGDVYYSGTVNECRLRMLAPWPKIPGAKSRALNSNHEMYSGGHGYFGVTLPAFGQTSSYFSFATDHYLLVGLDTGYSEHDLAGNQVGWLQALIANAGKRKVILFSHHQPFSVFESQGKKLTTKLKGILDSGRVFAWYWGHEHRCMIYDRSKHGFWGRCIGHSGYPAFRDKVKGNALNPAFGNKRAKNSSVGWYKIAKTSDAPASHILDGPNPYITEGPERYGAQGYATIALKGAELREYVHLPDGRIIYENKLA